MANSCPACSGTGRLDGLICLRCDGQGSRLAALLLRAYHLGHVEGIEAMRHAIPYHGEKPNGSRRYPDLLDRLLELDDE